MLHTSCKNRVPRNRICIHLCLVKVIAKATGDKKNISKAATKSEETPKREVRRKRSAEKDMKITSKAAVESSNRDGNSSEETPKTEVKRKNAK